MKKQILKTTPALMDAPTLRALKASIRHWKRMANGDFIGDEHPGPDDCALCQRFQCLAHCNGCPVEDESGKPFCIGTPYRDADELFDTFGKHSPEFKAAALKELKFLQSLLPK